MVPRQGAPRPAARSSKDRRTNRPSPPAASHVALSPSTREWLDFLAGLLAQAAREQHATGAVGVDPMPDTPTS